VLGVDSVLQQPFVHWSPRQHAWPVPPQGAHVVPVQTDEPPEHCSPLNTHIAVVGSQQPSVQAVAPVQQASPGLPHVVWMPPSKLAVVAAHDAVTLPAIDSVCPLWVHVMVQPDPDAADEQLVPSVASVPQRHSETPSEATVQHAEPDVVLDEHPSGTPSSRAATAPTVHTWRMPGLTSAIRGSSPRPRPAFFYGTGSGVTPFCLAPSHPSSTPVGPSFVFTILNSTRRFCSHAASLCPGSSGQNSP